MNRIFRTVCVGLPLAAWAGYLALGHSLAFWVAGKWGPKIVAAGDGKFSDAGTFIQARLFEGAWLMTATLGILLVVVYLGGVWARKLPELWHWVSYSVCGFVGLNVWLKVAMTTVLFWGVFWNGKGTTDSLTQFNMKLLLMKENSAPTQVILAGSSQIHAQVDHRLLNEQLGKGFNCTDLGFPGNRANDFLWLNRQLEGSRASIIVCYVSEGSFFNDGLSIGVPVFLSMRDLPEFMRLGWRLDWDSKSMKYAILANFAPVFRMRDSVSQRVLGDGLNRLPQRRRDSTLASDLIERANVAAPYYHFGPQVPFEMAALDAFIAKCHSKNQRVVICCGQMNPILASRIPAELRPRMRDYLHQLAAKHSNMRLLDQDVLPLQTEANYEDLTHVNRNAQIQFTKLIGVELEKMASSQGSPTAGGDVSILR